MSESSKKLISNIFRPVLGSLNLFYIIVLSIILLSILVLAVLRPSWTSQYEALINIEGLLIAFFAAVVALAVLHKKSQKVNVEVEGPYINKKVDREISRDIIDNYQFNSISDVSKDVMKERYIDFRDPLKFYIVTFKIKNISNFTWKNPTFTYATPVNQRYLDIDSKSKVLTEQLPHTNYQLRRPVEGYILSDERDIFSLRNLPYIIEKQRLAIWFTILLDRNMKEFDISLFISCENGEGAMIPLTIKPKELLERYGKKDI